MTLASASSRLDGLEKPQGGGSGGSGLQSTLRPSYSKSQLEAYLTFIDLPEPHRSSPILTNPNLARYKEHGLTFLEALMRHQLAKVPFENLALHYSPCRDAPLDVDELFERIVESGSNRGGHCLQLNGFFGHVLRSFGFENMASAARVNTDSQAIALNPGYRGSSYGGWNHMINIVTLSSERYLVDVGMNSKGPMLPIPLQENSEDASISSVAPRSVRLIKDFLPESISRHAAHKYWQLEQRYGDEQAWISVYAFADVEFIPADFTIMNWYVNNNRRSWFTYKVITSKMLLSEDGRKIIGELTLYERLLRRRIRGQIDLSIECQSEDERILLLQQYFDIHLDACERRSIYGTVSEIS